MSTSHPADDPTLRMSGASASHAPIDRAQFAPGTLIGGRYRIVSLLGSGGMGEVYRADDIKLAQAVALKFLPAALARDPVLLARLHDEVRLGRQVAHPNVCRIYDIGEAGDAHFVAMEYVDGEDLARLLRRIGRLPHDKATELAHGIAAGLASAHAKGILHRDLKPANVMIDGHGKARITDFGLALEQDSGHTDHAGTPAYMAPEQLAGRPASVQSDLYALGMVMYEMFTGRRPKADEDTQPPSSHVRDIDPVVDRAILRCLARDPSQRPRSAREVLEVLPSGDPLAVALAAGETPSPRLVAAAGAEGSLRRSVAWSMLALIATLLAAAMTINSGWRITSYVALDKEPAVLRERALEIARDVGLPAPRYIAGKYESQVRYLVWIYERDHARDRFNHLGRGPAAVVYWLRGSSQPLTPLSLDPAATLQDPPQQNAGDVTVRIDTAGRLVSLDAVPRAAPTKAIDWSPLLRLAGFDPARLRSAAPRGVPPHFADARAAWEGPWPDDAAKAAHIEAASAGGVPVWFAVTGPWDADTHAAERFAFNGPALIAFLTAVFAAGSLVVIILGWRNLRQRRGDRAGALRLGLIVFVAELASFFLAADYNGNVSHQIALLRGAVEIALFTGVLFGLLYIALEPTIRRRWPDRLISWTRLLAGGARDPMVGRDILVGVAAGLAHAVIAAGVSWLPGRLGLALPTSPHSSHLDALLGVRHALSYVAGAGVVALFWGLFLLVVLAAFTIALRRRALAAIALYVLQVIGFCIASQGDPWILASGFVVAALWTAVVVRYGLLAIVAAQCAFSLLFDIPTSFDLAHWYGPSLAVPIVATLALAIYGFRTALGGQTAFSGALIDE